MIMHGRKIRKTHLTPMLQYYIQKTPEIKNKNPKKMISITSPKQQHITLNPHITNMNITQTITKRLDVLPFSRWHVGMILAIGTIWVFDGYEVSLVSLFSKYILNQHTENEYKMLATMYQLGCIIGSVIFSILAYYYGRKAVFMVTLLIYGVGVVLCLMGNIFPLFVVGRLLTGISVGGEFTAIFTAVDQFLPPKVRGRVDIAIDGTWHLGGCIASIINIGIGETQNWKYFFAVGLGGLFGLAFIRRGIPESPRWLIMKGRLTQAQNVVNGIQYSVLNKHFFYTQGSADKLNLKLSQQQEAGASKDNRTDWRLKKQQQNKDTDQYVNKSQQGNNQIKQLEDQSLNYTQTSSNNILLQIKLIFSSYKMRFIVSCFLIYVQGFFFNSVYYEYPILLKNNFKLQQRQISAYMLGLSICSFVSTLLIGPFFDIFGRRKMLLITYGVTGVLLPVSNFIQDSPVHLEVLTCILFMFGSPASSSANLIASEIFPTSTRPIVLSAIFVVGMFGGMCGVWVDNYWVSGSLMILGGIIGFILCPKAQNKSLQQINKIKA